MKIGEIPEEENIERKEELVRNRTLRNTTFLSWENWKSFTKKDSPSGKWEYILDHVVDANNATVSKKE